MHGCPRGVFGQPPPCYCTPTTFAVANVIASLAAKVVKHVLCAGWDVVVLSETHCGGPEVAAKWLRDGAGPGKPWLGQAFWSHGTSASRGVAVLLRQGFAAKAKVAFADSDGRLLRVSGEGGPQGRPVSVVAVYNNNNNSLCTSRSASAMDPRATTGG